MAQRSQEDVLAGVLRIHVGGVEKMIPTLPMGPSREWQRLLGQKLSGFGSALNAQQSLESLDGFAGFANESILDLVVAYDRTDALGGREWLDEHADPAQLYAAVRLMGEVAFPFVNDLRGLLEMLPGLLAAASSSPSSTSSPSPSGGSTRAASRKGSTRRS